MNAITNFTNGINGIVPPGVLSLLIALGVKILKIAGTVLLCWILIRLSNSIAKKFFQSQASREHLTMSGRKARTLYSLTSSVLKYVIYFIGLFSILKLLGVPDSSLVVIASAGSVAIGLGAQSVVTDMMEGLFILFEDHYAVGDMITIQGITGTVESVTLRSTKLRDAMGCVHIIPNGSIGTVTNMSREYINAVVTVGISYEESIDDTLAVLKDEMRNTVDMPELLATPTVAGIMGLDDSAVTIKIVAKCKVKTNHIVEAELRRRIKNRLDEEGIEMPFPQRVVRLVQEEAPVEEEALLQEEA